jgi:hypothetical protein
MFASSHNAYIGLEDIFPLFLLHRPLILNFDLKYRSKRHIYRLKQRMNLNIVTCIAIAKQRLDKRIPATHVHATIGSPLLGNGPVNTFPLKGVTTIGSPVLSNGAVNRLRQQYRLCFASGSCKVVIREANSESCSCCRTTEQ